MKIRQIDLWAITGKIEDQLDNPGLGVDHSSGFGAKIDRIRFQNDDGGGAVGLGNLLGLAKVQPQLTGPQQCPRRSHHAYFLQSGHTTRTPVRLQERFAKLAESLTQTCTTLR